MEKQTCGGKKKSIIKMAQIFRSDTQTNKQTLRQKHTHSSPALTHAGQGQRHEYTHAHTHSHSQHDRGVTSREMLS